MLCMKHFSVLKNEVLDALHLESGAIIDCTLGYGGHSLGLLEQNPNVCIYAFDRDENALSLAKERLQAYASRIHIRHSAFSHALDVIGESDLAEVRGILADIGVSSMQLDDKDRGFSFTSPNLDMRMDSTQNLNAAKVINKVRGILADIGVSSMQLDDKDRGFSFTSPNLDMRMDSTQNLNAAKVINTYPAVRLEEIFRIYGEIRQSKKLAELSPNLDMRMDSTQNLNAAKVINTYPAVRLEEIFRIYGEIRQSKKLAELIVTQREKKPFESALELSSLIERHFPRMGGIHPATLAFQALRIEVNGELEQLQTLLQSIESAFMKGVLHNCKVAIISFHSLEDRIIKQTFKQWAKSCKCEESALKCECGNNNALGSIITKKPILPSQDEIAQNKRSRSAKLRIFQLGAKV